MTRGLTGPQVVRGPVTEDTDLAVESLEELAAMDRAARSRRAWPYRVKSAVDIP
jgi:hypothetical protein